MELKAIYSTTTSISVEISEVDGGFASKQYYDWYIDGVHVKSTETPPKATSAFFTYNSTEPFRVVPLEPDTRYTLKALVFAKDGSGGYLFQKWTNEIRAWTDPLPPPPEFEWIDHSVNAGRGDTFDLTARDWNALTEHINLVRERMGDKTIPFTYVYGKSDGVTPTVFSRAIYNEAVDGIKGLAGGGVFGEYLDRVTDDNVPITPERINLLRTELNYAISTM